MKLLLLVSLLATGCLTLETDDGWRKGLAEVREDAAANTNLLMAEFEQLRAYVLHKEEAQELITQLQKAGHSASYTSEGKVRVQYAGGLLNLTLTEPNAFLYDRLAEEK
jgi:hypothetical protein